tara:strand:- start:1589 stop:1858 length:270 start_codon:yes stop_codon:yes gene_type:complete
MEEKNQKKKDSVSEEKIVDDLKDSLFESIQNTSKLLNTIIEKIDLTIKDDEIKNETKEIINKINEEILETMKDSVDILPESKKNLFEEE